MIEMGAGTGVLACVLSHLANAPVAKLHDIEEAASNSTAAARTVAEIPDSAGKLGHCVSSSVSAVTIPSIRAQLLQTSLLVIPTDTRVVVENTMQANVDRNGLGGSVFPRVLHWGDDAQEEALLQYAHSLGGTLSYLLACDLAAPVTVVPSFVKTARILLERGRGCHASSGDVRYGDCKRYGCCCCSGPSSPRAAHESVLLAAAASSAAAVPPSSTFVPVACNGHPALLLCQQLHREFTAPLLDALRSEANIKIQQVSPDAAHPDYTSPRHQAYWITFECPLRKRSG